MAYLNITSLQALKYVSDMDVGPLYKTQLQHYFYNPTKSNPANIWHIAVQKVSHFCYNCVK